MNVLAGFHVRSIVVALSAIVLATCSREQVVSGSNVLAKWKPCEGSTGAPRNHTALESSTWAEGKLIINVKDNDYCGGTRIANPGYTLSGNLVQLSWSWELGPEKAVTACACDHAIRFELANLPAGDYQVQLSRVR